MRTRLAIIITAILALLSTRNSPATIGRVNIAFFVFAERKSVHWNGISRIRYSIERYSQCSRFRDEETQIKRLHRSLIAKKARSLKVRRVNRVWSVVKSPRSRLQCVTIGVDSEKLTYVLCMFKIERNFPTAWKYKFRQSFKMFL